MKLIDLLFPTTRFFAYYIAVLKFAMPETCENWLGRVNNSFHYVYQTHEIYQVLPYLVDLQ